MKKTILLSAFLLYSVFSFGQTTVVWTGNGDGTSWDDGNNWNSGTVPATGDFVKLKKNVTITGIATNNPGRIIIVKQGTNPSSVVLDLDLTIDGIPDQHSITFNEGCSLIVSSGRTLSVTAPNNKNGINTTNANQDVSFINNGTVTFSGGNNDIYLDGTGCSVENNGSISITSPSADGIHISDYAGAKFTNNSGATLTINTPSQDGIDNFKSFVNNGTLSIDGATSKSIFQRPGSTFSNTGEITINNVAASKDGIRLEGNFTNETNGNITVHGENGDDCISLNGSTFTNDGSITLYANGASATNNGIAIDENGATGSLFINTSNNSLTIHSGDVSKGRGIYVYSGGKIQNTGTITIDEGKPSYRFYSKGIVENQKGGTIDVGDGKIQAFAGTFTNDGLLKSTLNNGLVDNGATTTNNGFYDWSTSEFDTDNGVSLTNGNAEVTASGCDIDIAQVDYHWKEDDSLNGSTGWDAATDGTFTIGTKEVKNYPPTVITDEYDTDVQIKIKNLCVTAIPIELLEFKAKPIKSYILLSWATLTETNTDYFTIEKSKDAKHFEEIGTVKAAGNSRNQLEYSIEDTENLSGINYYRLITYDLDGNYSSSDVISVSVSVLEPFTVYPTRINKGEFLNVDIANGTTDAFLSIYNNSGALVYSTEIREGGKKIITIDDRFRKGIYHVKLLHNNEVDIKKFLIYNERL